jgi:hypothetical protein
MIHTELIGKYIKYKTTKLFRNLKFHTPEHSVYGIFVVSIDFINNHYLINNQYEISDLNNCEIINEEMFVKLHNRRMKETMPPISYDTTEVAGFKKGDSLRKKGYTMFKNNEPTIIVKTIAYLPVSKNLIKVNKQILPIDCLVKINSEEAIFLDNLFEDCVISDFDETQYTNPCISSTSSEPKLRYPNIKIAKEKLFLMKLKYPDKYFEAYLCPNCNKYHVGKPIKNKVYERENN